MSSTVCNFNLQWLIILAHEYSFLLNPQAFCTISSSKVLFLLFKCTVYIGILLGFNFFSVSTFFGHFWHKDVIGPILTCYFQGWLEYLYIMVHSAVRYRVRNFGAFISDAFNLGDLKLLTLGRW